MQFRILTAAIVFIGSYLPLAVILLAQSFDYSAFDRSFCWPVNRADCELPLYSPLFSLSLFALTLVCFGITLLALAMVRPSLSVTVDGADYIPTDLMNYSLPYVVSFMSVDYQETGKFVGFLVFLSWMFWITYRAGQVILNPVLIAFGWRLYTTTYRFAGSNDVFTSTVLSKGPLEPGEHKEVPLQDILIIKPGASS